MAEESSELEGPNFEKGVETEKMADGEMLLGHAFGEAVLVARHGDELFAIAATCTHYGGPLAKGLMVDCTARCPVAPRSVRSAHRGSDRSAGLERRRAL
jgi:Rieske Fe-S protein